MAAPHNAFVSSSPASSIFSDAGLSYRPHQPEQLRRQRVDFLLQQPLEVHAAIEIALLNQRDHLVPSDTFHTPSHITTHIPAAYYRSIAAAQQLFRLEDIDDAAGIAAELMQRMAERGNVAQREALQERLLFLEANDQLLRAKIHAREERDHFIQQLGLPASDSRLQLPPSLPELPAHALTLDPQAGASPEIRAAFAAYQTAYTLARHHHDQVLPLRQRVLEETLLRYNGMLASVFELLTEARAHAAAVNNATVTLRDFWIADNRVRLAVNATDTIASMPAEGNGND